MQPPIANDFFGFASAACSSQTKSGNISSASNKGQVASSQGVPQGDKPSRAASSQGKAIPNASVRPGSAASSAGKTFPNSKQVRAEDLGEQPPLRMDGRIVRSRNSVKEGIAKDVNQ